MKIISFFFLIVFSLFSAQVNIGVDISVKNSVKDLLADDYGNIYLYDTSQYYLTKYDSLGNLQVKNRLTFPFKIQTVQNPLSIPVFSENTQEIKFFDKNLAEIQTIDLRQKFGFIQAAYVEDAQQIWLIDESSKQLIQYNYRDDVIRNRFPTNSALDEIVDFIVYKKDIFILYKDRFCQYDFSFDKIFETTIRNPKRLRRENLNILILSTNSIKRLNSGLLDEVFSCEDCQIVDKNSSSFFAVKDNKLYLYPIKKTFQEN